MDKVKILLDIDGVIASFFIGFSKYLNKNLNAKIDLNTEPYFYNIEQWSNSTPKKAVNEAIVKWILNNGYLNIPIYPGAKEFVYSLIDKYDVYIVTARIGGFKENFSETIQNIIKNETFAWFKNNGIPANRIFFEHDKVKFSKEHGINIIIEDKLETAIKGARSGLDIILVNRNWNNRDERNNFNINIAYNYNDILNILKTMS